MKEPKHIQKTDIKTLGDAIRYIRWTKKLTQQQFAEELDCQAISISFWENGRRTPSYRVYRKLQNFIDKHKIKIPLP